MGYRYTYTEEFRREAVELARSSDRPRYRVAESLGVSDGALAARIVYRVITGEACGSIRDRMAIPRTRRGKDPRGYR